MLTKRQNQVLNYIKRYISKHDYAPSLEEIKRHLRLSSVSTAHYHVQALQNMGYLKKEDNQPRALDVFSEQKLVQIPFLGQIAAGEPIEAMEDKESIAVPQGKIKPGNNYFALRVTGESMQDENIDDGDIILIKNQQTAENGQKVVALIDNEKVTLKKIYKEKNKIRLEPANPKFKSILVPPKNLKIQGVVIDVIKNPYSKTNVSHITTLSKINELENKTSRTKNYLKEWINTIQPMDCVKGMKKLPENSIDLVVTSPPYDGIRAYNGFNYDLSATGKEIHRILKDGGIAVMVIQDQTKNFGKTLTSFRTIIDWCENIGFKLFECVIYRKYGPEGAWWKTRFRIDHEYMPIFLKGERPQYFNKEPLKVPSKHGGKIMTGSGSRRTDGKTNPTVTRAINPMKCRGTIWDYLMAGDKDKLKQKHPAVFPDKIPFDFIQCFCPPNGIVLDPFMGCGSTAVTAVQLNRNFIGFEISQEYCNLAKER
ncbi:MAG: transcriptional repressor LexA, partial [Candidatus Aureabacteria bacterium]|nr:transcriptional repressor LexA [Candidatus Auribacterota bacterium]